jgi:hypothetical protein
MNTLDVKLSLTNLHCFEEGDGRGSAEPYLWTVFFKIDGDTCSVTPARHLQGTATVVGTPGNHGDLPNHDVDPGEDVPIPAVLGQFTTQLKPIPLQQPVGGVTEIGGMIGMVTVLLEEDKTPNSAIAKGHLALNKAVRDALNALIPTLSSTHPEPTDAEIEAMKQRIRDAVLKAIIDNVSIFDWLKGLGNMDDVIGAEVFRFSHNELEEKGKEFFHRRFKNEGDWELQGKVAAVPVGPRGSLRVVINGIPDNVVKFPVHVTGPFFFSRFIGKTQTFTGLVPGTYTITASGFEVAHGKPTCKIFADMPKQQATVTANHVTSVTVNYTSEPCDLEDAGAAESANMS